jgi:hypothetical protein
MQRAKAVALLAMAGALIVGATRPAQGGGFTQPKGGVFADLSFRTLDSGTFRKLELQAYVEYGLADTVSLLIKSPYDWLENTVNGQTLRNEGFADQEVGLRWRLNRDPWWAVSLQGMLLLPPGYEANDPLPLGRGVVGSEFRLPISRSYQWQGLYGYGSVEAAYRHYFGPRSDEIRLFGELNVPIVKHLAVDVQVDHITALERELLFREEETDLTKLIGHLRLRLVDRLTLGVGGYVHVRGASGSGLELQLWYSCCP